MNNGNVCPGVIAAATLGWPGCERWCRSVRLAQVAYHRFRWSDAVPVWWS